MTAKIIIDVRSRAEFDYGNAPGSINIPLQEIPERLEEIKKMPQPIILCCASGARSAEAVQWLSRKGVNCKNIGSWRDIGCLEEG